MARQKLGQHFLVRDGILRRIALAACPEVTPLAIEIGPGRGALTRSLLRRAERVVAIELDTGLAGWLREQYAAEPRLTVVDGDATKIDLGQWGPAVLTGNLPYYAATAILERMFTATSFPPFGMRRGVFLVQREVAQRLTARPGNRAYGYLTVEAALFMDVESLFGVPPAAFRPPPKVDSAVIRLTPRNRAAMLGIASPEGFLVFTSRCFRQKRKTLRNNLSAFYRRELVDELPGMARRAEELTVEELSDLYRRLSFPSQNTAFNLTPNED